MRRSEFRKDAVERIQVIACKRISKPFEQISLLWRKSGSAGVVTAKVKPVHHTNSAAVTASNSFNGVRAHKFFNVVTNGFLADIKLIC